MAKRKVPAPMQATLDVPVSFGNVGIGDEKPGLRFADRLNVRIDRYALGRLGKLGEQTGESFSVLARRGPQAELGFRQGFGFDDPQRRLGFRRRRRILPPSYRLG